MSVLKVNDEAENLTPEERRDYAEFLSGDSIAALDDDTLIDSIRGIPKPVVKWLLGLSKKEPLMLDKFMDQIASKVNISLATLVINRLVRMNRLLCCMTRIEDDVFDEESFAIMDSKAKMGLYRHLDKTMSDFMEFVRKFVGQNQEMFDRRHPADELAELLRGVDPGVLRKLVEVLRIKGASLTENDIDESMAKPENMLLAELVK